MSNEVKIVEHQTPAKVQEFSLQISMINLKEMAEQRELFERFVRVQLKENVDFGVLPGTDKPSLWKPGAEKIANIYMLGSRIISEKKDFSVKDNWAIISYTMEIFHIPTGKAIAQCEGICSSLEKKYKERKVYEWSEQQRKKIPKGTEQTPIGDVLNTIAKMAQKRAYVGAVIIATKASDFFNHDLAEDEEDFREQNPDFEYRQNTAQEEELNRIKQNLKTNPNLNKAAAGSYDNFQSSVVKPVDPKTQLLNTVTALRKEKNWTPQMMSKFIYDNFGKSPNDLSNDELRLLIETLERIN